MPTTAHKPVPKKGAGSSKMPPSRGSASGPKASDPFKGVISLPSDLDTLLLDSLKSLYWAENHLVATLPRVQEASAAPSLRRAIGDHLKVTRGHVRRLEEVFGLLGQEPMAKKCDAMEGLTMEGEGIINSTAANSPARDRGLIMACQKVENYEMAAYRGIILLASQLGRADIGKLIAPTLAEEEQADRDLGALAEKK